MSSGRDARANDALTLLLWVAARRRPFSKYDLAAEIDCHPRTALRWIHGLERVGAIEQAPTAAPPGAPTHWRRRDECFRRMALGSRAERGGDA